MNMYPILSKRWYGWSILLAMVATLGLFTYTSAQSSCALSPGDVVRADTGSSVYLINDQGERLFYPNQDIFLSWHTDFDIVRTVPGSCLGQVPVPQTSPFGVNYPAGTLIKLRSLPDVFVVESGNTIRRIPDEQTAIALAGSNWQANLVDIDDTLWPNYRQAGDVTDGDSLVDGAVYNSVDGRRYLSTDGMLHEITGTLPPRLAQFTVPLDNTRHRGLVSSDRFSADVVFEDPSQLSIRSVVTPTQQPATPEQTTNQNTQATTPVSAPTTNNASTNASLAATQGAVFATVNSTSGNPANTNMSHSGMGGTRTQSPYNGPANITNPLTDAVRLANMPLVDQSALPIGPSPHLPQGRLYAAVHTSHYAYDDPIVFYGQPGSSHLHMFLGNQTTNAYSTTESLLNSALPSTAKGGFINQTAYWVPAMLDASGNPIVIDPHHPHFVSYVSSVPADQLIPFPEGLRMIAGRASANPSSPQDNLIASWSCESGIANNSPSIPECPVGDQLTVVIRFPQCNDGQLDSANQQSHMAYPIYDAQTGGLGCPSSHPIAVPEVQLAINIPVTTQNGGASQSTRGWRLTSDMYDTSSNPGGFSAHADWFGGWDTLTMQRIIDECLIPGVDCNNGGFPQQPGDPRSRELVGPNVFAVTPGRFLPGGPVSGNQAVNAISPLNPNPGATLAPPNSGSSSGGGSSAAPVVGNDPPASSGSSSGGSTATPDDDDDNNQAPTQDNDDDDDNAPSNNSGGDTDQTFNTVNGFTFTSAGGGYVTWWVDESAHVADGLIFVMFGPNPGIGNGAESVTSYARAYNEMDVYIPFEEGQYVRLCHGTQSGESCQGYSEEIYVPAL